MPAFAGKTVEVIIPPMSDLDDKIRRFEEKRDEENNPKNAGTNAMASAGHAGYDIMVAVVFFTVVGGLLDWQLGTMPWITLVLFFLGFATGVYNAWRTMNAKGDRIGLTQSAKRPEPHEKI
jgi:F0F1-type ATP synthase assembly protein I